MCDREDVDGGAKKWSDSGFVLKEDAAGFAEGLDAGGKERDEFLFGAQAGGKTELPFMELGEIAGKARLRREIGSRV